MKTLIIAITLLFSAATLAATLPKDMAPAEFTAFIESETDRGMTADMNIFLGYLNKTYAQGTQIENVSVAIQFVNCSIMWRNVHDLLVEPDKLTHEMLKAGIWRAIEAAKVYIFAAGGDPGKVESVMVPSLLQVSIISRLPTVDINTANIYTCTALDLSVFVNMQSQGAIPFPPAGWVLKPIPNINEIEPEPEIGQQLPKYDT